MSVFFLTILLRIGDKSKKTKPHSNVTLDLLSALDILGSLRRFHGEQDEDEEDDDEGSDALDDLILEDGGNSDIFNSNSDDSLSLILGSNDDSYTDYSDDTLRMTSEDENAASEPE